MFRTLPAGLPGYLHPPLPVSTQTIAPRPPPPELSHRKLLNGSRQHRSAGAEHQGDEAARAAESLTDSDSVKGLGETSDFLNMTHVIKMDPGDKTLTLAPVHKDLTKGFAQTWSKGEETEKGEDEDEGEEEEDNVDEEEDNDTSAETEGRSSSLDDWTEKQTEETQTAKPEELKEASVKELKEASVPDGEQKAAEISEKVDTTGGDQTDDGAKPANGTADSNSKSQSGANKKLSLFRRLSFSRTKQTSDRDQTPAQGDVSGDAAVLRGDGEPLSSAETDRGGSQQMSLPSGARGPRSGARGPRSGACTAL